jgi:hypothetical protein
MTAEGHMMLAVHFAMKERMVEWLMVRKSLVDGYLVVEG